MVTRDNESPVLVPEFLTERMASRTALNQSHDDHNPLLDTTIPAQERVTPVAEQDPIHRRLTSRPVCRINQQFNNSLIAQSTPIQ